MDNAPTIPGEKNGNFLTKDTAGMPNWVWGIVIIAGIGVAILVPRLFKNAGAGTAASSVTSDPTLSGGNPYAGSSSTPDYSGQLNQLQTTIDDLLKNNTTNPGEKYITVAAWPNPNSSLADIAKRAGVSLQKILDLNPILAKRANHINAGEIVRIS